MSYWDQWSGQDVYAASQQNRYTQAVKSGDTDLQNRLQADAARVGYALNAPTTTPTAPVPTQQPAPQQQPIQQQQPQIIYQQVPQQQQQSSQQDPQITAIIQQMQNMIGNQPTVESIMNSPAFQQMQQAIFGQMDQSMKGAWADLAARGVLGQGSTPAEGRIGQVAGHYGQQLGSLVPSMMGTAQQMHQGERFVFAGAG